MAKVKVLILGSSGMLGSAVLKYLSTKKELDITAPPRKEVEGFLVDGYDYIINCIGIIKQKLDDIEEAIKVNSILPYQLSKNAPKTKIIQIATDCAFSGAKGNHVETDLHDATDVYGKTKSLGEVETDRFFNIRCSIIGRSKDNVSLLEWFLSQPKYSVVKGYTNHYWNGITTFHFAKLCYAIIKEDMDLPPLIHFFPANIVTKYDLLEIFAKKFKRTDIQIKKSVADHTIDRSLSSNYKGLNDSLWRSMGYPEPPTMQEMINEL